MSLVYCTLAFQNRFKNVIVFFYSTYCFRLRRLNASQENSKTFPKSRKTSFSFSGSSFNNYVSNFGFYNTCHNILKHWWSDSEHWWSVLKHRWSDSEHWWSVLKHRWSDSKHWWSVLKHRWSASKHWWSDSEHWWSDSKYWWNLSSHYWNSLKFILNSANIHIVNCNFAISSPNYIHDLPGTIPGSTVYLKRFILPS